MPAGSGPESSAVSQVIAVVDGAPLGVAPLTPADNSELEFVMRLPPQLLGGWLDVVGAETGQSLLEAEIDLASARGLRWGGWTLRGRRVSGSFRFEGPAAPEPGIAIPVDIRSGTALYGSCYAVPSSADPAVYEFATDVTALPPPKEAVEVVPHVGGIRVKDRLRVASQRARLCRLRRSARRGPRAGLGGGPGPAAPAADGGAACQRPPGGERTGRPHALRPAPSRAGRRALRLPDPVSAAACRWTATCASSW